MMHSTSREDWDQSHEESEVLVTLTAEQSWRKDACEPFADAFHLALACKDVLID
jgi:hypothetical protein